MAGLIGLAIFGVIFLLYWKFAKLSPSTGGWHPRGYHKTPPTYEEFLIDGGDIFDTDEEPLKSYEMYENVVAAMRLGVYDREGYKDRMNDIRRLNAHND